MNHPILFLSHGAPSLLTGQSAAKEFLQEFGSRLDRPRAWIVVSAHWQQSPVGVTASSTPRTIHDFHGFGDVLERFQYPVQGDPALAADLVRGLETAGLSAREEADRGLDHGVWVPMALITPEPAKPVIQVSLPAPGADPYQLTQLGTALGQFAQNGYRVVFSGSLTHSLRDAIGAPEQAPVLGPAEVFADAVRNAMKSGDTDTIIDWRALPEAARNHPTPEHFEPLIAALAASHTPQQLHESWTHGALAMDVWSFDSYSSEMNP